MRLLVTIEAPSSGHRSASARPDGRLSGSHSGRHSGRHDLVVTYSPETRVCDLAAALAGTTAENAPTNVFALPGASSVPTLTGPVDLYLGDEILDGEQRIDESPVRHGVVLGLGQPSSQRLREP